MKQLLNLPGKAHRSDVNAEIVIPADALPLAESVPAAEGIDPMSLAGIVIDDPDAEVEGDWTLGTGLAGYVGQGYLYAAQGTAARIHFRFRAPRSDRFELRLAYLAHENRATNVPIVVRHGDQTQTIHINMRLRPPLEDRFISLGEFDFSQGETVAVSLSAQEVDGFVHADALQIIGAEN